MINYKHGNIAESISSLSPQGIDRIIEVEFGKNLPLYLKNGNNFFANNCVISSYGSQQDTTPSLPFYELMFRSVELKLVFAYILPPIARSQANKDIVRAMKEDCLHPIIAKTFTLDEICDAHAAVESGNLIGNVVINIKE